MKNLLTKSVVAVLFAVVVLATSCKKYEEGPRLSLRSKKARVANKWTLESRKVNGVDQQLDADEKNDVMELTKDGKVTYTDPDQPGLAATGTWAFANDKEHLMVTLSAFGFSIVQDFEILRLKEKELWVKYTDTDEDTGLVTVVEEHYKGE